MIRRTRPNEIKLLPQIETDADRRFARAGLLHMLNRPPATIASLDQGRGRGLLWVAVSPFGQPIGFALMKLRGGTTETARALGFDALYLSTYRDVPWNAPFYERRGFREVPRATFARPLRPRARERACGTMPASFGGDGQAHLLAGRRHVRHRGAAHVALVALVVEVEAAMHGAAVVPDHQVLHPPAMRVDELALRGMVGQLLKELRRLLVGHAADRTGVARDIEAHAAGILQAAHQHLRHRLKSLALALVEIAETELGARGHDRMLGHQARDTPLSGLA